jgi:hypothetical protein
MASVTDELSDVTTFPDSSWTVTTGCVPIATPVVELDGDVVNPSRAAVPDTTANVVDPETDVAPASVAMRVLPTASYAVNVALGEATPFANVIELSGYDGAAPDGLVIRPDQMMDLEPV